MKRESVSDQPLVTLTSVITNKSSQNLLEFLSGRFKYLSAEEWRKRVMDGAVKVNGRKASEGQPLRAGDEVAYTTDSWEEPAVKTDYRVVFEDDALLILSKPAPLPVHAIGAYFRNTLVQVLRRDRPDAMDYKPVHRLDSETSGLIVFAKEGKHLKAMQKQFAYVGAGHAPPEAGFFKKTYHAIVFGKFPAGRQTVDAPIGKKVGSPVRMKLAVIDLLPPFEKGGAGGNYPAGVVSKPSVTEFDLLETRGDFSLVEARPLTGRTHQIRVHLEHLGFPIVGDKIYSGNDETFLHFYEHDWDDWLKERVILPRLALHAFKLEFTHPVTGKRVSFEDPLREDLADFWNGL